MAITVSGFQGQTVGVLGLGKSGLSAARALVRGGAEVVAWDDRDAARKAAADDGVAVGAVEPGSIAALVMSPGIPHTLPTPHPVAAGARALGIPLLGDVELLFRSCPEATYVGITGTNGKSTTTALIGHVLAAAGRQVEVGGNLGTPALDLEPLGPDGVYVLELSSYQLELVRSTAFRVSVLLNISADHLERHGGLEGYAAAKQHIFDRQTEADTAVIGVDDPHCRAIADRLEAQGRRVTRISVERPVERGVFVRDGMLVDATAGAPEPVMAMQDAPALPGPHNAQNAAAAYAAARALELSIEEIVSAVRTFPGLAHRQERIAEIGGVLFVNDSKATNAEAAARALACYDRIYWIAGGRAKAGGYGVLAPHLSRVARALLIGEAAEPMAAELSDAVATEICGDLESAVLRAFALARPEAKRRPVVLLSPACASFDQFADFEARGDAFRYAVAALGGGRQ